MYNLIILNKNDNVAVASMSIPANKKITLKLYSKNYIPFGHKIALSNIKKSDFIYKYGQIIGIASKDIFEGEHVHSHNLEFIEFERKVENKIKIKNKNIFFQKDNFFFDGFKRKGGKSGTRNYIGLLSTVNCSATVVKKISDSINGNTALKKYHNIDGAVCLKHSSGCGMNVEGYGMTVFNQTIEGFKSHPNFSKVFVIGLGCECAQISLYKKENDNVVYMNIQDEGGTQKIIENVSNQILEMLPDLNRECRIKIPISELTVALQCGGSDSYSGITANPALGYASDLLVQAGGSTILSETPELYGAEHLLIKRTHDINLVKKLQNHIKWWKNYASINQASLDNNPSPGNKKGGLTTILEKSLGAVSKSGTSEMIDVLSYAESLEKKGFNYMDSPGYDPVSVTGQVASGCNIICFTTGRGSCFGFKPAPSLKIATNTNMFNKLEEDMDINAGVIMDGESNIKQVGEKIFNNIIETASGKLTKSEINGYGDDEFNPWIIGATM